MPNEIAHLSRPAKALRYPVVKEIRCESLENVTSGAEALSDRILYGAAEELAEKLPVG
jgi:hypothetical protein